MPIVKVGDKRVKFPDEMPPEQIKAVLDKQFGRQEQQPVEPAEEDSGFLDKAIGAADVAGTMITGAIAEPVAGLAGIVQSVNPFAEEGAGAEAVEATREFLTQSIKTEEGRKQISALADKLKFISEPIQELEESLGEAGFEKAGPIGGAIGETLPTLALELTALGSGKALSATKRTAKNVKKAVPDVDAQNILRAGKEFDVPVLKSDVLPPSTYGGKLLRTANEKLGPLGSGRLRAKQQASRVEAVSGFIDQFDVDLDSPFAAKMVKSLKAKSNKTLEAAGVQRRKAIDALIDKGDVEPTQLNKTVQNLIEDQNKLGAKANTGLIDDLQNIQSAGQSLNFEDMAKLRTEVLKDLQKFRRGEDVARLEPVYQSVKSAIDKDMMKFAGKHDRAAAADWIRSNRKFANEFGTVKQTELKRILSTGDTTPENIINILKRGKMSELKRLNRAMGPKGQANARAAIIQNALEKSGWPNQINPNSFATNMSKPGTQKAVNAFFKGADKKQVDGLRQLLEATRRAQDAGVFLETGQVALPLSGLGAFGVAASQSLPLTVGVTGAVSAFGNLYESAGFRNLMLKIANMPKGAKKTAFLDAEALKVLAALEAAKQTEEAE